MDGINNFTNKAIGSMGKNNKLMIEQVGRAKTYIDEKWLRNFAQSFKWKLWV